MMTACVPAAMLGSNLAPEYTRATLQRLQVQSPLRMASSCADVGLHRPMWQLPWCPLSAHMPSCSVCACAAQSVNGAEAQCICSTELLV